MDCEVRKGGFSPMSAPTTASIALTIDVLAEQEIAPLFQSYQRAGQNLKQATQDRKRTGEELGRVLLKWHTEYKQQGSRTGEGFEALLKRLGIPKKTAYRRMHKADPKYFGTPDTKFDLERVVAGLSLWARKLPDGYKNCPEKTLDQLRDIQTQVNLLLSDADHIRRAESDKRRHRKQIRVGLRRGSEFLRDSAVSTGWRQDARREAIQEAKSQKLHGRMARRFIRERSAHHYALRER
jgi:hypothetical protein